MSEGGVVKYKIEGESTSLVGAVASAKQAMDGLDPKTQAYIKNLKGTGEAAEHSEVSHRALHAGLHQLGSGAAETGTILMRSFANPTTAAFLGVTVAAGKLLEAYKENEAEQNKMVEDAAKPLTNQLEAQKLQVLELATAAERLHEKLEDASRGQDGMRQASEEVTNKIREQAKAAAEIANSGKSAELADLDAQYKAKLLSEEQFQNAKLEIEQRYKEKAREAERKEQEDILNAKIDAGAVAQGQQGGLDAAAKAADEAAVKAKIKADSRKDEATRAAEHKRETKKALDEFEERVKKTGNGRMDRFEEAERLGMEGTGDLRDKGGTISGALGLGGEDAFTKWKRLKTEAKIAEENVKYADKANPEAAVEALKAQHEADRATRDAEQNRQFVHDNDKDVAKSSRELTAKRKTDKIVTANERSAVESTQTANILDSDIGKTVSAGARAEAAKASGQKINKAQEQASLELSSLLQGIHQNISSTHETLRSHAGNFQALANDAKKIRAEMDRIKQQMKQLHVP